MYEFLEAVENSKFMTTIATSNPVYGTLTAMHYFTLFLLTGMAVAFDLHLLGVVARRQTTADFADEIFPWLWTSMGLALFSGFSLALTSAGDYYLSPVMRWKILIVLLGVAITAFIRRGSRQWGTTNTVPMWGKLAAVFSLLLWLGAILAGNDIAALCGLG
jgi:hypothetical protein